MTVNELLDSDIKLNYTYESITYCRYHYMFRFFHNKVYFIDGVNEGNYNFTIDDIKNKTLLKNKKFLENL